MSPRESRSIRMTSARRSFRNSMPSCPTFPLFRKNFLLSWRIQSSCGRFLCNCSPTLLSTAQKIPNRELRSGPDKSRARRLSLFVTTEWDSTPARRKSYSRFFKNCTAHRTFRETGLGWRSPNGWSKHTAAAFRRRLNPVRGRFSVFLFRPARSV